jgi:hypothetical protein
MNNSLPPAFSAVLNHELLQLIKLQQKGTSRRTSMKKNSKTQPKLQEY